MPTIQFSRLRDLIDRERGSGLKSITLRANVLVTGRLSLPAMLGRFVPDEPKHRAAVDAAATYWAEHRSWPQAEPEVAEYILLRMNSAGRLLESLEPFNVLTDAGENEVLRWLLVEYWRVFGRAEWLYHMAHPEEPVE